jgi:hypothetical protein
MYKSKITKREIEESDERTKDMYHYLTGCTGWYNEDENGDFVITDFGKACSDNDDYIHGMGKPYEEMRN